MVGRGEGFVDLTAILERLTFYFVLRRIDTKRE
jgi:hypothetical protein